MADTTTEAQEAPETGAETPEIPNTEAQAEEPQEPQESQETTEEESADDDFDSLPDWAKKEVRRLRQEAAARRVENGELREKAAKADSGEEALALVKELQTKLASAERERTVADLARTHNLPDSALVLLTATDPEQLTAQATALAELTKAQGPATPPPLTPSGGRDPMGAPQDDPAALIAKAKALRY